MKRGRSNYHALNVLKKAEPKLPKAIITNCNKELYNCISECVLNVLNSNLKSSDCNMRKLKEYNSALPKVADRHVSLSARSD